MTMGWISLLTDFGLEDEYVGVMKAVVATINPGARIVDITHQIPPQDIVQAAFVLKAAYKYFPAGTVHLAVVDPEVGTGRPIVAARAGRYTFLGPDNGVLWPAIEAAAGENPRIVKVTNTAFFLEHVSHTFHGRDIFAPLAAHLSLGLGLEQLGPAMDFCHMTRLPGSGPHRLADGSLQGTVVGIDRFGNLITNISRRDLEDLAGRRGWDNLEVSVGRWRLKGVQDTYAQAAPASPLALVGSRETLEVAVNQGSAAQKLGAVRGQAVMVSLVRLDKD